MLPLMWMMAALMAASTGANAVAQRKTGKAQARVREEERKRRGANDKRAEALTMDSANLYTGTPEKEQARASELTTQYSPQHSDPTTGPGGTRFLDTGMPTGSQDTIEATKSEIAKADARSARRAAGSAKLEAFGDVMGGNKIAAGRNSQDVGQTAGFTQGWQQNVLPALMAKASLAGRDWATAADVMKLAAAVMSPWAFAKAGAAEGASETTKGVLDQMGGMPKEFAGQDLFGMSKMFGPAQSFTDAASIAEVVPAGAALMDNGLEEIAMKNLNPGMFDGIGAGAGFAEQQGHQAMRQRILQKQMRGQPLSPEESMFLLQMY